MILYAESLEEAREVIKQIENIIAVTGEHFWETVRSTG